MTTACDNGNEPSRPRQRCGLTHMAVALTLWMGSTLAAGQMPPPPGFPPPHGGVPARQGYPAPPGIPSPAGIPPQSGFPERPAFPPPHGMSPPLPGTMPPPAWAVKAPPPEAEDSAAAPIVITKLAQLMTPVRSVTGALLTPGRDSAGSPSVFAPVQGLQRFIRPVAAVTQGADTYVADVGLEAIFHFDVTLQKMAALPDIRALTGMRLFIAPDRSLFVLDPPGRRVLHYARDGSQLGVFADGSNLGRPVGIAFDEVRGRILVADGLFNQLVAFHLSGKTAFGISLESDQDEQVRGLAGIATDRNWIYLSDTDCNCVVRVTPEGKIQDRFGEGDIGSPGPLAADRHGRVYVVDTFDGSLKIFARGELHYQLKPAEIGLQQINDVTVNEDFITLSDGAAARVDILRLALPARR